jgi:thiamine biosynthesis lipoprotein
MLVLGLAAPSWAAEARRSVHAMGTRLTLRAQRPDEAALRAALEQAVRECERIEAAGSTWRADSLFSRLNAAGGKRVTLGDEWVTVLSRALDWSRRTGGSFDPVLGALVKAWDLRRGGREPGAEALAAARMASGARLLLLEPKTAAARLADPRAGLEEGGFLKGYALGRMASVLRQAGATAGVLDFGGQLLVFGAARVASVAAPGDRERAAFELRLENASLSTSGTSERGRHILDPRTGARCPAWGSVSVVAEDAFDADVLSTALYVLGPVDGRAWAEAHHVAALFQPFDAPAFWTHALDRRNPQPVSPQPVSETP